MTVITKTTNDRVSIQLKTLVNLAKPAALIKLHKSNLRARHSGGYVSRFKGRGMEFDESRLYQPGDDIRSIDWRVTARTGKTHTKVFREERERPVFISVDNRASMQFATRGVFKSVQAAKIAAILAWTAQQHGDRIGGQSFNDFCCQELKPQNGKHAVLRFFNTLIKADRKKEEKITLEHALFRLLQHVRPGSLVYIISDFRGLNQAAEHHLARLSRHCEVILIHIFDPLESHLPNNGRYRFTDGQRDAVIDTYDEFQVNRYQQRYQIRLQHLQKICRKTAQMLLPCCTTDDPMEVLR